MWPYTGITTRTRDKSEVSSLRPEDSWSRLRMALVSDSMPAIAFASVSPSAVLQKSGSTDPLQVTKVTSTLQQIY